MTPTTSLTTADALRTGGLPRNEALLLLAQATGRPREALLASPESAVASAAAATFMRLAERRVAGEPIAHLLGHREFYGRRFAVDRHVLIPRPETELLVDLVVTRTAQLHPARVLDLGTGSGVIAITLALECPGTRVVGTDASPEALRCARANAVALGAEVEWRHGDWFDTLDDGRRFDIVVSNPPYIAAEDPHLREGDLRFEPIRALSDGADGLEAIRTLVAGAPRVLVAGGAVFIEHGHDQAAAVRGLMVASGYEAVGSTRDLSSIERVTAGTTPR